MIPRVAQRGQSFKGAAQYYLHDKEANTNERVAWTSTHNLPTQDAAKGFGWMAYTAMNAERLKSEAGVSKVGRKSSAGVVYSYSLAWHPEEEPQQDQMEGAALGVLKELGLGEHEAVIVAHNDTDHKHVHVVCNLVNPENGRMAAPSFDFLTTSRWAERVERENGKIYCEQRVQNNEKRRTEAKQGKQLAFVKHREQKHKQAERIQELYMQSDSGLSFKAALHSEGIKLALGDRRGFVLIDNQGKISSLSRQLKGHRAKEIRERFSDLQYLPKAKEIVDHLKHRQETKNETKQIGKLKGSFNRLAPKTTTESTQSNKAHQSMKKQRQQELPEQCYDEEYLRQLDELRAWEQKSDRSRSRLETELEKTYEHSNLKSQIEAREKFMELNKSLLARVTGRAKELSLDLEALKKNYANVNMRLSERRDALEKKIEESRPQFIIDQDKVRHRPEPTRIHQKDHPKHDYDR